MLQTVQYEYEYMSKQRTYFDILYKISSHGIEIKKHAVCGALEGGGGKELAHC